MEIPSVAPEIAGASGAVELERQYLLQNYGRYPLEVERGKGCYLFDRNGKRYLDLITGIGVNALGHAHPRLTKVLRDQAGKLIHTSNLYYHPYQGPLAERIVKLTGLDRAFFCNSGAEAIEGAMKMARSHGRKISPDKYEIVAVEGSFHGRTFGALSITGQVKYREPFEPMLPGAHFVQRNDITALEQIVTDRTAAIVLEVIQGEGGVFPLSEEFVRKARELADRHNALLVFDEIQCGVGRPGVHFAYKMFEPVVMPDIAVAAKPLGCGLPIGFVAANDRAATAIAKGMHGTTFGGGALVCRVALEFFDILDEILPDIVRTGDYFRMRLEELARKFKFVKEVRARGLMLGMELDFPGQQLVLDGINEGILFNCTHDTVLRFLPPYIIKEADIDRGIRALTKVLKKAKADRKAKA